MAEDAVVFEWDEKNQVLEIHGNPKGLKNLAKRILSLSASSKDDHLHLMTTDWGGEELSSQQQCPSNRLIHHVKIYNWSKQES